MNKDFKLSISDLIIICHSIAIAKGFWEDKPCPDCFGEGFLYNKYSEETWQQGFACKNCHGTGKVPGRNDGEAIALMHSELSEALEALRKNNTTNLAEELADCIIRIFDYCGGNNIELEKALLEKIDINKERPFKHGKEF